MVQWINKDFPRPHLEIINRISEIPTGILSDCMNRFQTLDASIKPLHLGRRIVGHAFTVQAMPSCNWGAHQALSLAKRGDILVIDAQGSSRSAIWGHVMTVAAKNVGLAGVVIDGFIRDAEENRNDTLQIFCKGICPGGPHKGWPENINVAISCGGVPIFPGDIIVGDDDGVVSIPTSKVVEVIEEARKRMEMEKDWYKRLRNGETTLQLLGIKPV